MDSTSTRMVRRGLLLAIAVFAGLLLVSAAAYACTAMATFKFSDASAPAGSFVQGTGKGFRASHGGSAGGPVEIRFERRDGALLWVGDAADDGTITFGFTLPEEATAGYHVFVAVQNDQSGNPVYGTPGRQSLEVVASASAAAGSPAAPAHAPAAQPSGTPAGDPEATAPAAPAPMTAPAASAPTTAPQATATPTGTTAEPTPGSVAEPAAPQSAAPQSAAVPASAPATAAPPAVTTTPANSVPATAGVTPPPAAPAPDARTAATPAAASLFPVTARAGGAAPAAAEQAATIAPHRTIAPQAPAAAPPWQPAPGARDALLLVLLLAAAATVARRQGPGALPRVA